MLFVHYNRNVTYSSQLPILIAMQTAKPTLAFAKLTKSNVTSEVNEIRLA
jgi:hypothetical protein